MQNFNDIMVYVDCVLCPMFRDHHYIWRGEHGPCSHRGSHQGGGTVPQQRDGHWRQEEVYYMLCHPQGESMTSYGVT